VWGVAELACVDLAGGGSLDVRAGDQCLVMFDLRFETRRAIEIQKALIHAGATVCFVGIEPGSVQVGPVVRPGEGRCLGCLGEWIRTNHPTGKTFNASDGRPRPAPCRPFSSIARHAISTLIGSVAAPGMTNVIPLSAGVYYAARVDTLEVARHAFLQVTHCPSCDLVPVPSQPKPLCFMPRVKQQVEDKRLPNSKLSPRSIREMFVDRHSGLIKHVFQNRQSDLMPLFTSERPLPGGKSTDYNHGRAFNYQTSELIAILEGVERYAGTEPRGGMVALRGSRSQMVARFGSQVVDPAVFIMHTDEQRANPLFKFEAFTDDLECGWVWGHSIRRNEPILVPEQMAYYNVQVRSGRPVNRFIYDSSNGCALGGSIEEAVLGGLHEVVERDAYFATWYSRVPPLRIDLRTIDDRYSAALIARSEAAGFEVHLFDMTSEARIPVVGAMIVDPSDDAKVKSYCASACDGRWSEAIFSALAEVTTSMGVYRKTETLDYDRARAMFADDSLVRDMFDHVLLYALPESFDRLRFILGGEVRSLQACRERLPDAMHIDLTENLEAECARVLKVAEDIIVVDQTFPELQALGLSAAKVLVPGMLPVTFGHQYRRIDLGRLNRFARFNGVQGPAYTHDTINPHPHNFP
jgi:ribosomal protein S12 methylthiotransferase accessory factor